MVSSNIIPKIYSYYRIYKIGLSSFIVNRSEKVLIGVTVSEISNGL